MMGLALSMLTPNPPRGQNESLAMNLPFTHTWLAYLGLLMIMNGFSNREFRVI